MCFSATASFSTALLLIPAGSLCLKVALNFDKSYRMFAAIPLLFGVQQMLEGSVWLALENSDPIQLRLAALAFLFFSHFFWLIFVPLCCYYIENQAFKRKLFLLLASAAVLHGAILYLPLLLDENRLNVAIRGHSIRYTVLLLYDGHIPADILRLLYFSFVVLPFLLSCERALRIFGLGLLITLAISLWSFNYALTSVWCYFASLLSIFVAVIIVSKDKHGHERAT